MKKLIIPLMAGLLAVQTAAAAGARVNACRTETRACEAAAQADTAAQARPFKAYLYNKEYKIYLRINLYDKDVKVPGQELYGLLDGYIGSNQSGNMWMITSSVIKNATTAEIEVINDYGSEDFTATLRLNRDGSYTFRKNGGSTLKFAVRGKWQKLPGTIELQKR